MAFSFTGTVVSGNEVLLSYSGLTTTTSTQLKIYRHNAKITDLTDEGLASATQVTETATVSGSAGTFTDYNAGATNFYYLKDGDTWCSITNDTQANSGIITSEHSPEMRADYVPADLNTVSMDAVYIAAQNSKGGVSYRAVNVPAGKNIALIVISTQSEITDAKISKQLGQIVTDGLSTDGITDVVSFQILAKGLATSVYGYTPQLSGSTQIKYVASN